MDPSERPADATPVDDAADTQMFRAFVDRSDGDRPRAVGVPFRLLTLAVGLLVFAGIVWLLLK
jgi:hypothetical protein